MLTLERICKTVGLAEEHSWGPEIGGLPRSRHLGLPERRCARLLTFRQADGQQLHRILQRQIQNRMPDLSIGDARQKMGIGVETTAKYSPIARSAECRLLIHSFGLGLEGTFVSNSSLPSLSGRHDGTELGASRRRLSTGVGSRRRLPPHFCSG